MVDSKTFRLLEALSPQETKEFGKYLQCGFFCRKPSLHRLYAHLEELLYRRRPRPPKDTAYWEILGEPPRPGEDPKPKINLLLHELKTHLEDYLVWKEGKENPRERDRVMAVALSQRKASEFLLETGLRMEKYWEGKPLNFYYRESHYISRSLLFNHPYPNQFARGRVSILEVVDSLDKWWAVARLVHGWNAFLQGYQFTSLTPELRTDLGRTIEAVRNDPELRDNPFAYIYTTALDTGLRGEFELAVYEDIREKAFSIIADSEPEERMGLMNLLINYLILVKAKHGEGLLPRIIELYQWGLEKGTLLKHGYISYGDFVNMVNIGCKVGRFDWVEKILGEYGTFLNPRMRDGVLKLSHARLAFFRGDFSLALHWLNQKGQFLNEPDKLYDKLLRLYCYYELGDMDLVESALEAFRKYIQRNTDFNAHLAIPLNTFSNLLRRLIAYPAEHELEAVCTAIKAQPPSGYFEWLLRKAEEKLQRARRTNAS